MTMHFHIQLLALKHCWSWELFDHPPYNPDLVVIDFHLLTYLKAWFGSQQFNNNEELMEGVKTWLSSQTLWHRCTETCTSAPVATRLRSN
jgi:hypothetical protein